MKISILHLGCAKNLVDTELMCSLLIQGGHCVTLDEDEGEVIVINTCSFIHDAEKESVQAILRHALKGKRVVVTGCLAQKHKEELKSLIPEISSMIGVSDIQDICAAVENRDFVKISPPDYVYPENVVRRHITVGSSVYIKIAEGCNCKCGYCIIPSLRGKYVSRPMENIVDEAQRLVDEGASEIILIAQDTTSYGIDLYGAPSLAKLLTKLNNIKNIGWIRVMYTYPSLLTEELLGAISDLEHVVKYIDVPLQHSHPEILKAMLRPAIDYERLIDKAREKISKLALRTSLIVGYPGENDNHYQHLYDFVEKMKFDRLGVFEFSREKNTHAYALKNQVPAKVKKQRKKEIMNLQRNISYHLNSQFLDKNLECLIETVGENTVIARSYRDAPEIDGNVFIKTDKILFPGEFEIIKIVSYNNHDLIGTI